MTLLDLQEGEEAEVMAMSGRGVASRLEDMGFRTGSRIRLVGSAPFGGPVMIEDVATGARVMIGRGMAGSIEVGDARAAKG